MRAAEQAIDVLHRKNFGQGAAAARALKHGGRVGGGVPLRIEKAVELA